MMEKRADIDPDRTPPDSSNLRKLTPEEAERLKIEQQKRAQAVARDASESRQ